MLRESWEVNTKTKESVVSYVLSICDKMDTMYSLLSDNLREAQKVQKGTIIMHVIDNLISGTKYWYCCQQIVMAQCQGPYPIIQRTGLVDYYVDMHDCRKCKCVFHINMLKKWHLAQQPEKVNLAEKVDEYILAEDVPTWHWEIWGTHTWEALDNKWAE